MDCASIAKVERDDFKSNHLHPDSELMKQTATERKAILFSMKSIKRKMGPHPCSLIKKCHFMPPSCALVLPYSLDRTHLLRSSFKFELEV
jgi:hypothetical protein